MFVGWRMEATSFECSYVQVSTVYKVILLYAFVWIEYWVLCKNDLLKKFIDWFFYYIENYAAFIAKTQLIQSAIQSFLKIMNLNKNLWFIIFVRLQSTTSDTCYRSNIELSNCGHLQCCWKEYTCRKTVTKNWYVKQQMEVLCSKVLSSFHFNIYS